MRVAIVGAGLAGAACAYVLKRAGAECVIYEAGSGLAPGASGNSIGLYNPRLSAEPGFYTEAFLLALKVFSELKDLDWNKCGALHLMTNEVKEKRFRNAADSWAGVEMELLGKEEASRVVGVEVGHEALFLPQSGTISPKKLCERYAEGVEVHFNSEIKNFAELKADVVIVANGMGAKKLLPDLPLKAVRGQITEVRATAASRKLKTNLCYGGYFTPERGETHMVGATFQRWLDHSQIIDGDDRDNIGKLAKVVPELAEGLEITNHRAAVRTTTQDHMPIIGQVSESVYVSTGHGSHGILSSIAAAHQLTKLILKK